MFPIHQKGVNLLNKSENVNFLFSLKFFLRIQFLIIWRKTLWNGCHSLFFNTSLWLNNFLDHCLDIVGLDNIEWIALTLLILDETEKCLDQILFSILKRFRLLDGFEGFCNQTAVIILDNLLWSDFEHVVWVSIIFFIRIWGDDFFSKSAFHLIVQLRVNCDLRDLKVQELKNQTFNLKEAFPLVVLFSH